MRIMEKAKSQQQLWTAPARSNRVGKETGRDGDGYDDGLQGTDDGRQRTQDRGRRRSTGGCGSQRTDVRITISRTPNTCSISNSRTGELQNEPAYRTEKSPEP